MQLTTAQRRDVGQTLEAARLLLSRATPILARDERTAHALAHVDTAARSIKLASDELASISK